MNPFADIFEPVAPASLEGEGRQGFSLTLERYYSRDKTIVVIPDGTTQILPEAFRGHGEIEVLELPSSLESIGEAAFRDCSALKEVAVPEAVFEIGERAFSGCAALRTVALPRALMSIGESTFSRCVALEALLGGDEVYEVGASAFSGCANLQALPAFPHLEYLGSDAFAGCSSLSRAILPPTVQSIGAQAFRNCRALAEARIPESAEEMGRDLFAGCVSLEIIGGADALVERFPDAFPRGFSASYGFLRSQDRSEQVRSYRKAHACEIDALKSEADESRERARKIAHEIEGTGVLERARRQRLTESLSAERKSLRSLKERIVLLENPPDEEILKMISSK